MNISEISYWENDDCICTISSIKVPEVGEKIYFNTLSDETWFEAHGFDRKLFTPGTRAEYEVVSVSRHIGAFDIVHKEKTEKAVYTLPAKKYTETFDVHMVQVKNSWINKNRDFTEKFVMGTVTGLFIGILLMAIIFIGI